MDRATFRRALDLLKRAGCDQVRLLGGEPTLHPEFPGLVREALDRGFRILVFSNGRMPGSALAALRSAPEEKISVLINAEAEGGGSPEPALRALGRRATLGINLHRRGQELGRALAWIAQYDLNPVLRLGLAHPALQTENRCLHPADFEAIGEEIADLAVTARAQGVKLEFDCGFVPCMFPEGFLEWLGDEGRELGRRCGTIPDVLDDGTLIACYPLSGAYRASVHSADSLETFRRDADRAFAPYRALGIEARCETCKWKADGTCLGGCLARAMNRLESAGPASECAVAPPHKTPRSAPATNRWVLPYIDQPVEFWASLRNAHGDALAEVYFPLAPELLASGRPPQPSERLEELLASRIVRGSALLNPVILPAPVDELAPRLVEALRRLNGEYGVASATISSLLLARRLREALPDFSLTASTLMEIATPYQARLLAGICDTLVPASRLTRDLAGLRELRAAFPGRIRLMVNEGCLPGCPFRTQHFAEMASGHPQPASLCEKLLAEQPWLRLTGAWIPPPFLDIYAGLYDELKLDGRVTLRDPARYRRVLSAYVNRTWLPPEELGTGPAGLMQSVPLSREWFLHTCTCGHRCEQCTICRDLFERTTTHQEPP